MVWYSILLCLLFLVFLLLPTGPVLGFIFMAGHCGRSVELWTLKSDSTKEAKQILDDIIEVEEEESKQGAKLDQLKPERVDHLKSGFSLAESQQLYTQRIRSRVDSRAGNITDSFLAVHANNDVNGSFMSLKSAQILQKYKAGEAVHMSNADASTLWMESQLSVAVSQKRSRKGSYISQKSKTGWRNSVYVQLFKSKRYTLMFFCDTMGFFAYMIVMQVCSSVHYESLFMTHHFSIWQTKWQMRDYRDQMRPGV